jgi:outer membrane protein assembly factor BamB
MPPGLAALQSPLRAGMAFRGFEIGGMVGSGGMAVVYKARQTTLDRAAAIKVLAPEYLSSPRFVQRFEREARVLASLNHPNLVHIYDFGRESDLLFLAMEFVDGSNLQEWLKNRPSGSLREFLILMAGICDGLDRIHRAGLVHRDLKPSNVLIPREGGPKISDFGLAVEAEDSMKLTLTGSVVGTPHYMSPEQVLGKPVDRRSDLYSLGVILFQGLVGRLPFEGPPTAVLIKHAQEPAPSLGTLRPGIPVPLQRLTAALLAKDPSARPASASEVKNVLLAESVDLSSTETAGPLAVPTIAALPIQVPAKASPALPTPAPPTRLMVRVIMILIGVALVEVLLLLFVLILGQSRFARAELVDVKPTRPDPGRGIEKPETDTPVPEFFHLRMAVLLPEPAGVSAVPGLEYEYYEGTWDQIPEFRTLKPAGRGIAAHFDLNPPHRKDEYAFRFQGLIRIPADGEYTFTTSSDDGSRLFLRDREIVSNDGKRGVQERSGIITLKSGLYPITVSYFQYTGPQSLEVYWEGPGLSKQIIASEYLLHSAPAVPDSGKLPKSASSPGDWPQWRGPNRDNVSTQTGLRREWPQGGPPILWKATALGESLGTVSVSAGRVYTMGNTKEASTLMCLNAADGRTLWRVNVGDPGNIDGGYPGPRSTPGTDGVYVYALTSLGKLVCFTAMNGQEVWSTTMESLGGQRIPWGYCESPLIDGDLLVCAPGGSRGTVAALNKHTGALVWQSHDFKEAAPYSSLVPADFGRVHQYVVLTMKSVAGIHARTGALLWRADFPGKTAVAASPVVWRDRVFVSSAYGVGSACFQINANGQSFQATQIYATTKMQNQHGGLVQHRDHVFGLDNSGLLKCINLETGDIAWEDRSIGKGSITCADGLLLCRSQDTKTGRVALVEASPEGYKERGRFSLPAATGAVLFAQPVVADRHLFLRDADNLYCFDLEDHEAPRRPLPLTFNIEEKKNIKWVADLGTETFGSPVVAEGRVFIGTNNGKPRDPAIRGDKGILMCFSESDGTFLWQAVHDKLPTRGNEDTPSVGIVSAPAVVGDLLYYVSNRDELVCRAVKDGKSEWMLDMRKDLGVSPSDASTSSPLVVDDLVFVVTGNGRNTAKDKVLSPTAPSFIAVDRHTGTVVWTDNSPGEHILRGQWGSPAYAVVEGRAQVVFPGGDGWLYSFEPKTGKLLWKFNCKAHESRDDQGNLFLQNNLVATPVFAGHRVLTAMGVDSETSGPGCLRAIDARNSGDVTSTSELWRISGEDFQNTISTVAVRDGLVYALERDGYVNCIDLDFGRRIWRHDMLALNYSSPLVTEGKVYVQNNDDEVLVFEHGKVLKLLAKNELPSGLHLFPPAVSNGCLFISGRSRLFAIQESAK